MFLVFFKHFLVNLVIMQNRILCGDGFKRKQIQELVLKKIDEIALSW